MTIMIRNSLSRLTASFPSGRGLAGTRLSIILDLLKLKTMEVLVTTGATICAKLQSNRSKIAQTLKKLNWMVVKLCRLEEIQYWMTICSLYNERSSWQRHTRQTDKESDPRKNCSEERVHQMTTTTQNEQQLCNSAAQCYQYKRPRQQKQQTE